LENTRSGFQRTSKAGEYEITAVVMRTLANTATEGLAGLDTLETATQGGGVLVAQVAISAFG